MLICCRRQVLLCLADNLNHALHERLRTPLWRGLCDRHDSTITTLTLATEEH